jgi:hypothetical protein
MNGIYYQIELPLQGACWSSFTFKPKAFPWAEITWAFSPQVVNR